MEEQTIIGSDSIIVQPIYIMDPEGIDWNLWLLKMGIFSRSGSISRRKWMKRSLHEFIDE